MGKENYMIKRDKLWKKVFAIMVNTNLIKGGSISEEQHKLDMEKYPLKRYGEPEDIANLCVFLASDEASYINGQTININGGMGRF